MNLTDLMERCTTSLSDADVRKICRNRGFSAQDTRTGTLLRHVLLSDAGLAPVMASLSPPEVAALHRLHVTGEPVNVSFFESAFRTAATSPPGGTFNQRYQPIFKEVQEAFIRRGLVMVAEDHATFGDTALARLRFGFPPRFAPFLPPVGAPRSLDGVTVEKSPDWRRLNLLRLLDGGSSTIDAASRVTIVRGRLHQGESLFTARHLATLCASKWSSQLPTVQKHPSPVPLIAHLLGHAPADTWTADEVLEPVVLQHFHEELCARAHRVRWGDPPEDDPLPSAASICDAGWSLGLLERCHAEGKTFYRPTADMKAALECFLSVEADGRLHVDLATIPFESLEAVASVSRFVVEGRRLLAVPDPVLIGRALGRDRPVLTWLCANATAYRDVAARMALLAGRQVLHENLIVARIRDKVERLRLEQALSKGAPASPLVSIGGEYIAFPRSLLAEVEKVARRSGLAVRKVVP